MIRLEIIRIHITVVIISWPFSLLFTSARSSVLLCDSALKLVNSHLFELSAHNFLFSEPSVLGLPVFVSVDAAGRLRVSTFCLGCGCSCVWGCHVEQQIVQFVVVGLIFGVLVCAYLGILQINIDKLVITYRHVFLYEVINSLTQRNLVIQTRWSHKTAWLTVAF